MNALCKRLDLLLCLQHRELRGLHDRVATDVAQTEVVLVLLCRRLDDIAHEAFHLRDEPYKDRGVAHVERSVEGGEHHRQTRRVDVVSVRVNTHEATHHVDEGIENCEHPEHAKHVEREVCKSRSTGLRVGTHGSDV